MARVHYIHLTQSNLTQDTLGGPWVSGVIDLYANTSYTNYSVVKSDYGLNSVEGVLQATPNDTWVGMKWLGTNITDTGYILNNRYVDTSGIINIIDYSIIAPNYSGNVLLDYYASDSPSSRFPLEWSYSPANIASVGLQSIDAQRYAIIGLRFDTDPGNFDFYLRVEIGGPVMTPLYNETKRVLKKLPSWMAMQEPQAQFSATPQLLSPASTGSALVNAAAGEFLDDLVSQITYRNMQLYIGTADLNQKSQLWKTNNVSQYCYSFIGDGVECVVASDSAELYNCAIDDDIILWDEANQKVYSNKYYNNFAINGVISTQEVNPIWNAFDDLGLSVSLTRLPQESNVDFKSRILDVFINPLGTGMVQFQTAIRRELSLWQLYGSTPDSYFLGATPTVLNMWDLENPINGFVDSRGLPTQEFLRLVDFLAAQYPTTWGYLKWDQAFSDLAGPNYEGYNVLPELYDATPPTEKLMQSGVGDLNDLKIFHPQPLNGPHDFVATITVRGNQLVPQNQFSPVTIQYSVEGIANQLVYNNPGVVSWFTLNFILFDGSQIYYSFPLTSQSDVNASNPTPTAASIGALKLFAPDGSTDPTIQLRYKTTGVLAAFRILASTISSLTLNVGKWNYSSSSYLDIPSNNNFLAWFSNDPTQQIDYTGYLTGTHATPVSLTIVNSSLNPGAFPQVSLSMESTATSSSLGTWYSIPQPVTSIINDSGSITTQQPAIVPIPNVNWSNYLASPADKQYIITLNTITVFNADGTSYSLDPSYISLNGSTAWSNNAQTVSGSTANLNWAVITNHTPISNYPFIGNAYQMFEASTQIEISGIVDENGPWRDGFAPNAGNTNFLVENLDLNRSLFNIPLNATFQPTWVGVESSNDSVITWLSYNSIIEDGNYNFQQNSLFARLTPNPQPQWNPSIHSGTFFENEDEYYLFADPNTVNINSNLGFLPSRAMQGAPIIVQSSDGSYMNQICFYSEATPYNLGLTNSETVLGTDSQYLYASYNNIENLTVTTTGATPSFLPSTVSGNQITLNSITDYNTSYILNYSVKDSFFADNNAIYDSTPCTYLQFSTPNNYTVTYESSFYNAATPVPINLNPLYSSFSEGFLFISNEEYDLSYVSAIMSPGTILSDPSDYAVISLRSYDVYGNPKPEQIFNLSSSFGVLSNSTVMTNNEGYASTILYSTAAGPIFSPSALLFISGNGLSETIPFSVKRINAKSYKIYTTVSQQSIRANGSDLQMISGLVRDSNYNPIPFVTLNWNLGRSLFDLYSPEGHIDESGTLTTLADGSFIIGPFTAKTTPGYWFVSIYASQSEVYSNIYDQNIPYDAPINYDNASGATPFSVDFSPVGDVVFWLEYADNTLGNIALSGLPSAPIQLSTPAWLVPSYTTNAQNPLYYNNVATPNSATPAWLPPTWFALPYFDQWQHGVYSVNDNVLDYSTAQANSPPPHPDEKSM